MNKAPLGRLLSLFVARFHDERATEMQQMMLGRRRQRVSRWEKRRERDFFKTPAHHHAFDIEKILPRRAAKEEEPISTGRHFFCFLAPL